MTIERASELICSCANSGLYNESIDLLHHFANYFDFADNEESLEHFAKLCGFTLFDAVELN